LFWLGIKGQWSLEKIISSPHDIAVAISTGADGKFELLRVPENFLTAGTELVFALVKVGALAKNLKIAIQIFVKDRDGGAYFFELRRISDPAHGSSHVRAEILVIDVLVTTGADAGSQISDPGRRVAVIDRFRICRGYGENKQQTETKVPHGKADSKT
jgi:hypothetical protein